MKHFVSWLALALILSQAGPQALAAAGEYRYMPGTQLEQRLKAGEPVVVLDIQVEEEFQQHHIKGAVPTHAYPVKTDADRAKLQARLEQIRTSDAPVVIVCPRGAGGATRTYDYLQAEGIPESRLFILEQGQAGWSCAELTEFR
ncbi:MAG TPA: rhodanese-like domain-containing protein [Deferrisomatales bacterium]|nr:rhodanese-like domain-containing protein [Deferrisomatales bacterium]